MESKPRFTVIMRSKNSAWVIGQALAGLYSQTRKDFELVVVDSGSTDETLKIVAQYPCKLVQIPAGDYYPGRVLNEAIRRHANTEIIVFQNSDVVPLDPQTLQNLIQPLENGNADATFSRQIPRPEAYAWVRRDYAESFPAGSNAPEWITFSLPLAAFVRKAWEEHAFYEDAWGSEDTEWGHWARRNGLRVEYMANARVMHSHNYTLRQIYGRRFIEGEADAYIYHQDLGFGSSARRFVASTLRDLRYMWSKRDVPGAIMAPVRRAVYQWAYRRGHQWGRRRIRSAVSDASHGQRQVLSRY